MQITERFARSASARPPDFIALVAKMPRCNRKCSLLLHVGGSAHCPWLSSPTTRVHACGVRDQMIENGCRCTSPGRRLVDLGRIRGAHDATSALTPFTWPDVKRVKKTAPESEAHIEEARTAASDWRGARNRISGRHTVQIITTIIIKGKKENKTGQIENEATEASCFVRQEKSVTK